MPVFYDLLYHNSMLLELILKYRYLAELIYDHLPVILIQSKFFTIAVNYCAVEHDMLALYVDCVACSVL